MKLKSFYSLSLLILLLIPVHSQVPYLFRSAMSMGGNSITPPKKAGIAIIQQSIGQNGISGSFSNEKFELRQGFIQPFKSTTQFMNNENSGLTIWPNPFNSELNILLSKKPLGNPELSIFSISGKLVYSEKLPVSESVSINIGFLPDGMYLIRITDLHLLLYSKVIKY